MWTWFCCATDSVRSQRTSFRSHSSPRTLACQHVIRLVQQVLYCVRHLTSLCVHVSVLLAEVFWSWLQAVVRVLWWMGTGSWTYFACKKASGPNCWAFSTALAIFLFLISKWILRFNSSVCFGKAGIYQIRPSPLFPLRVSPTPFLRNH